VTAPLVILQGATQIIVVKGLRDAANALLDPTGWAIHVVIRKDGVTGQLVATWRYAPRSGEGLAEVVDADPAIDPDVLPGEKWVYLHITSTMFAGATWSRGKLQGEITDPLPSNPPRVARIPDTTDVILSLDAVT